MVGCLACCAHPLRQLGQSVAESLGEAGLQKQKSAIMERGEREWVSKRRLGVRAARQRAGLSARVVLSVADTFVAAARQQEEQPPPRSDSEYCRGDTNAPIAIAAGGNP